MGTDNLIDQTIERIRAFTIAELRTRANGHPQESMAKEDVIYIVNWVLGEASDALKDALGNGHLDGQTEHDSWWGSYDSEGFVEVFRGGMPEGELLPRVRKDGSR